jgi:hypothetical protein
MVIKGLKFNQSKLKDLIIFQTFQIKIFMVKRRSKTIMCLEILIEISVQVEMEGSSKTIINRIMFSSDIQCMSNVNSIMEMGTEEYNGIQINRIEVKKMDSVKVREILDGRMLEISSEEVVPGGLIDRTWRIYTMGMMLGR